MLSAKTINVLAQSLAGEVIDDLYASEEYVDFMQETIPDLIKARMGDVDEDLLFELSLATMDKITLKACE
jgi:hypothetical protein